MRTRPACFARNDSSSNSFGVSLSSARRGSRDGARSRFPGRRRAAPAFPLALHAVPQRGAHARQQLANIERLVDVIIRAEIERLDLLGFALARRENDDRHVGPFARARDHVLAVAVRQAEIEQHDVGRVGGNAL